jgi:N4-gp56 family major capsid protein
MINQFGDISPRTAAYVVVELLERGKANVLLDKFGMIKSIPKNETKSISLRRYEALSLATTPITEGVTPAGQALTFTDYTATLQQYSGVVNLTDVVLDTHEDDILGETTDILAQQSSETLETVKYNALIGGLTVYYANGVAGRSSVVDSISRSDIRKAARFLKRQRGRYFTNVFKSGANFGSVGCESAYFGVAHTDVEDDLKDVDGFKLPTDYGSATPMENEIGATEHVRWFTGVLNSPVADAGGAAATKIATTNAAAACDVYLYLIFSKHAYAIVPFAGKNSVVPMVTLPKPNIADPAAQRGAVAWKAYLTALIVQDNWMARIEAAVTN